MHDAQAFARTTLPHPRSGRLLNAQPLTPEGRAEAERRLESLQVNAKDDFLFDRKLATTDADGKYPVGTVGHVVAAAQGGPMLVTVVHQADGWKVDLRWWVAMLDQAEAGAPPAEGTPEYSAKTLILAMVALDREQALRFAVPAADADLLFADAPSQREPSGVLEAAAVEMPLVEVGPGEFYRMPPGRIVEGSTAGDRKLLVGQFGPVEMPFVLRFDNAWRIEAEPYFALMNR
jgi:hypothetical protein